MTSRRPDARHCSSLAATPLVSLVFAALLLAGAPAFAEEAPGRTIGEPVGEEAPTSIATILDDEEAWEGREVVIEGNVTGVCAKAGCWMEINDGTGKLQVKVEDGVLVFPTDAMGGTARARGTVERIELDRRSYIAWREHEAEDRGETFDLSTLEDGPWRIVRLAGLGAEIDG
ncbi:MAG: DUF4920 domain-containing protein [Acidobacteriota bacterium]